MTCAQSKGSKSTKMRAFGCLEIDTLALMYQVLSRIRRIVKDVAMMVIVVRRIEPKRMCRRIRRLRNVIKRHTWNNLVPVIPVVL